MEIKDMIGVIVAIAVGAIVASAIIPSAVSDIAGANTTGWDTASKSVWGLLGVIIVLAILMVFLRIVK